MCANFCTWYAGAAPPNQPQLGTVDIFPYKAVIHFTISNVAYDPETYTVMYGTSMDTLTSVSNTFNQTDPSGLAFLTDTNLVYTITVNGLNSKQMYHYRIVSTNSNSNVSSVIGTFTTVETRK